VFSVFFIIVIFHYQCYNTASGWCIIFVFFSYSNDYSYEVKQAGYISLGVGTMFFIFMAICGGNAAVSRYLEKDKARIHDTKFLAYVSISLL